MTTPTPKCNPTLTECPRCKNDISKCDGTFLQSTTTPTPSGGEAMKPDEEDALIARYFPEVWASVDPVEIGNVRGLICVVVAAERERCARVCEEQPSRTVAVMASSPQSGFILGTKACAAAIRKGD